MLSIPFVQKSISPLIMGCAFPAMLAGENVNDLLDEVYACGINTFDTAENYGLSEVSLGNWIASRHLRDQVVIISKCCHPYGSPRVSPDCITADLEQSLHRLQTDFIDIYLLHRDDESQPVGPIVETLNRYHKEGKIGAFGGSNWTHQRIEAANAYAKEHNLVPFTVSSPNFGLANQLGPIWGPGCVTISGADNMEARAYYTQHQIPTIAYSSLGRGMLTGRVHSNDIEGAKSILDEFAILGYCYEENFQRLARVEELAHKKGYTVPQIALAWLLHQNFPVAPVVAATNVKRMESNLVATTIQLTADEVRWLDLQQDMP